MQLPPDVIENPADADFGWAKNSLRNTGVSHADVQAFMAESSSAKVSPAKAGASVLRAVSVEELLKLDVKPREILLHPFPSHSGTRHAVFKTWRWKNLYCARHRRSCCQWRENF